MALNLLAPLYCAQAANAVMQGQAEGGSIVNITSVSGIRPSPGTAAYGAAKAGLINLTQSLAIEWAPKVRVNALSARHGGHRGGRRPLRGTRGHSRGGGHRAPGAVRHARGRGRACLFLASPLAAYVTGANLVAHGGGERPAFLAAVEDVLERGPS